MINEPCSPGRPSTGTIAVVLPAATRPNQRPPTRFAARCRLLRIIKQLARFVDYVHVAASATQRPSFYSRTRSINISERRQPTQRATISGSIDVGGQLPRVHPHSPASTNGSWRRRSPQVRPLRRKIISLLAIRSRGVAPVAERMRQNVNLKTACEQQCSRPTPVAPTGGRRAAQSSFNMSFRCAARTGLLTGALFFLLFFFYNGFRGCCFFFTSLNPFHLKCHWY